MKNVIILGKGKLGINIAKHLISSDFYNLKYIVPVIPEPEWEDSIIKFCIKEDVKYIESGKVEDIPGVEKDDYTIDLVISVLYKNIVKKSFIDKCNKIINIHLAPLPKYRGVRSINWALKNKELEHGVTIHKLVPEIDKGPIYSQIKFTIYPEIEEVIDVYNKAIEFAFLLFKKTIDILDEIKPRKQDEREASYYSNKDIKKLGERETFTKELSKNT